jgi:hypothetical protein
MDAARVLGYGWYVRPDLVGDDLLDPAIASSDLLLGGDALSHHAINGIAREVFFYYRAGSPFVGPHFEAEVVWSGQDLHS